MFFTLSVNSTDIIVNALSNVTFGNHTAAEKICIFGKINYFLNATGVDLNATDLSQAGNGKMWKMLPKRF